MLGHTDIMPCHGYADVQQSFTTWPVENGRITYVVSFVTAIAANIDPT